MDHADVAILISSAALLVSGSSLGWQVAQWLLSGGRPKAVLLHGVLDGSAALSGPVARGGERIDVGNLRRQGYEGPEALGLQVTNHGRAPIVVDRVTIRARGGVMSFVPIGVLIGAELPHKVEPGANNSWYVELAHAHRLASSSREVLHERVTGVYMTAELGTGKSVKTYAALTI